VEANQIHDVASNAVYCRPDYECLSTEELRSLISELPKYSSVELVPSEKYPEHLFNRRYLRSSYNDGGFNNAISDLVGKDHGLYWIFEPLDRQWDGDDGILTGLDLVALRESRKRAAQVACELTVCDPIRVMSEAPVLGAGEHMWSELPSEDEVLNWYRQEKIRDRFGAGYSTAKGSVFGFGNDGVNVLAVTLGRDVSGREAAILVYRLDPESIQTYVQSAEIVVEFCDEAISLIGRDGSVQMYWSG